MGSGSRTAFQAQHVQGEVATSSVQLHLPQVLLPVARMLPIEEKQRQARLSAATAVANKRLDTNAGEDTDDQLSSEHSEPKIWPIRSCINLLKYRRQSD